MKNKKISKMAINLRRIRSCYWYTFLEILAVKNKYFHDLLINWRKPVFLEEIKMADITDKDNVLLIGCGVFPTETMIIAEETKANVVGIDNSPKAVKLANKFLKNKKLSEKIKIEYGDGANYPVKDFDKIFIAINVWPIDSVLDNLSKNMKTSASVMCRGMKSDIDDLLIKNKISNDFNLESSVKRTKTESYMLIKK